jgi:hypothetical protein
MVMSEADKTIQEKIEAGLPVTSNDADEKIFRKIFNALEKEPDFVLPASFAAKVIGKIQQQQAQSARHEYIWMCAGIFLLIVTLIVSISMTEFKLEAGFLEGISRYKGVALFGISFILVLQWIDKRFIRSKQSAI